MTLSQIITRSKFQNSTPNSLLFGTKTETKHIKNYKPINTLANLKESQSKPKVSTLNDQNKMNSDKWLGDEYIEAYFDSFTTQISKCRTDVVLINPSVTQVIKESPLYDVLQVLTSISFKDKNIA